MGANQKHEPIRWRLVNRLGQRGLALIVFACVVFTYGSGLVIGYHPTFSTAGHWPVADFGWVFITVGLICLTGAFLKNNLWCFAIGMFLVLAWFALLFTYWKGPVGWNGAVSWLGVGSLLIVSSGWPWSWTHHGDKQ